MSKLSKLLVVAIFGAITILSSQAQEAVDLTGEWNLEDQHTSEPYYYAELTQNGRSVEGTYTRNRQKGTIQGKVQGNQVVLYWDQPYNNKNGMAVLSIVNNNKLIGPWYYGNDSKKNASGTWTFTRR